MSDTKEIELLAAFFTLAGDIYPFGPTEVSPFSFKDRVEAAAKAGYKGVGVIHADVQATAAQIGLPEMKRIIDGNGIKHVEMEFLPNWYVQDERRPASDLMRREMFEMAQALGIRDIKIAPGLGRDLSNPTTDEMTPNIQKMTDEFAQISREAADFGTAIVMEVMPFSNVRTLEVGRAIVEGANQPNGGLLVDIWHIARGGISFEGPRAPLIARVHSMPPS